MHGVTRLKHYPKSGARIYIPQKLLTSPDFPFLDDDLLKIEFGKDDTIVLSKPQWWELLNWDEMPVAYEQLPQEIKDRIHIPKEEEIDEVEAYKDRHGRYLGIPE